MAKKSILLRSKIKRARALIESGKLDEAGNLLEQIARQDRMNPDVWFLLGGVHGRLGKPQAAAECYRKAVDIRPDHPDTHYNLGIALRESGDLEGAMRCFQEAIRLKPDYGDAHDCLAHAFMMLGELDKAAEAFGIALRFFPQKAELHSNLGTTYQALGRLEDAVRSYRRAIELNPMLSTAYDSLGSALSGQGRFQEALDCYRESLRRHPANARAHSNYLLTLNYLEDISPEQLFEEHREWGRRHGRPVYAHPSRPHRQGGKLRIGYVSSDLRRHSIASFFEPLIANHDRERFEIFCYASVPRPDDVTERLRGHADHWRDIATLSDEEAASMIREDGVDILIDLNGHTGGNRLGIFVRKPSPLQVTWLGYPNTTGLSTMDYRISDGIADPEGKEAYHTERLLRLPSCFLCYRAPDEAPDVAPLPVLEHGYVTFGSFNNLAKISHGVIRLWADVVRAVDGSRLLIKNPSLTDEVTRDRYRKLFIEAGVPKDRLELVGHTPTQEAHLRMYARVDIALDTFPYNGTTTTCEALWMGVPVVTLVGDCHAGRVGMTLLHALGREQWIAHDREAFVSIVAAMSEDRQRLAEERSGLRRLMQTSPLGDAVRFARDFEAGLCEIYRGHAWARRESAG